MHNYADKAQAYDAARQLEAQIQAAKGYNNYNNNAAIQAVPSQTNLETFENTLRELLQLLDMQGDKVEMLYAKLNGGLGGAAGSAGNQTKPQPSGHIAIMTDLFEQIGARFKRTDAVVDQLRSII